MTGSSYSWQISFLAYIVSLVADTGLWNQNFLEKWPVLINLFSLILYGIFEGNAGKIREFFITVVEENFWSVGEQSSYLQY